MKCKVYVGTSLDGFIARPDGSLDWLNPFANEEAFESYAEFMKDIDAIVIGRGTFETVLSFEAWPYDKPVYVMSRSLQELTEQARGKATLVSYSPEQLIEYLEGRGIIRIYVDGGQVIQDFLRKDLIDELIISKVPVLIGAGIPLFGILDRDLAFNHERTVVKSNGLLSSYYTRNRK